ncbi:sensor histidine kinase [Orenia marismortui]|uniref:histidine kinase n=1 Tax=Orenia marismortui TaxID=46469 RepID=A0A4R8H6F9_9FIRM|nr:ATP-binding protein [Orenia marismortui]TDX53166.1 heavy metal sensor kinase [Orenia marismortui]
MLSKIKNLKFWPKSIPISLRLTLTYALIFSLAIIIISATTFYSSRYLGFQRIKEDIKNINQEVADYIRSGRDLDRSIFKNLNIRRPMDLKVYNQDGELLFKNSPHAPIIDMKRNLGEISILEINEQKWNHDKKKRFFKRTVYLNNKLSYQGEIFYIQVSFPLAGRDDIFNILMLVLIATNILGIIVSIIVGNYISKKILRPIGQITDTAKKITINHLDDRIDSEGPQDELRELATTFNNMIDRLQESIEKQKAFVSDASHELRTPISVIQGYIDLLDRWGKSDQEVLNESIEAIKSETMNMKKLLEQLLFLARSDREKDSFERVDFELDAVIAEVYRETELIDKEHKITLNNNDKLKINGDEQLIKQLLRIIIDNSLKYTEDGGKISIDSKLVNQFVEITIEDTGTGIAKEDLDNIFDRFYRADKSRNRETGGTGLGLSIAKWIVDNHLGKIEVESKLNQGTKVIIKLPTC